jgi:hypothetical protein
MKIIDQTPFYKANGEISLIDRGKAILQYGSGWIKEIEAQKLIIAVLDKNLDRRFTLLRNVTPSGMNAMIPLILIGPTGIYVACINPHTGTYSARGDQWGVISGGSLKPENPNLLIRTERMARAVQIHLQHQGYSDLNGVDPILLCSDPTTNVDSVRPIIRVVMRDALERFAVSVAQARVILSPESVFDIVDRLLKPPQTKQPEVNEVPPAAGTGDVGELLPDPTAPVGLSTLGVLPVADSQSNPPVTRRKAMSGKQWALLIVMFVIWSLLAILLVFLVLSDQPLAGLTP